MVKAITLTTLRNLAAEIGCELIYMIGRSKTEFEKVTHGTFSQRKNIGLSENGEMIEPPVKPEELYSKLSRAVTRQRKKR